MNLCYSRLYTMTTKKKRFSSDSQRALFSAYLLRCKTYLSIPPADYLIDT